MPSPIGEADEAARLAILAEIKVSAESVRHSNFNEAGRASTLRDLALAYRYIDGGAQPGSVTVKK